MDARSERRRISLIAAAAIAAFLFTGVGSAAAADRFVDAETGADAGTTCAELNPCATLAYAITNSEAADTIRVDNGTYAEAVALDGGRSLIHQDFVAGDGAAPPLIDGGGSTAVTTGGTGGGTISGVRVHSNTTGVQLNAPTVIDNVIFDDPDATDATGVQVAGSAAGSEIRGSDFSDPSPSATRARFGVNTIGATSIHNNSFEGFNSAVGINAPSGGDTIVEHNTISGTHNSPFQGNSIVAGANPGTDETIIRENHLSSADGISVNGISTSGPAQLVRNEVSGHYNAVFIGSDYTGATIRGDRYWGNEMSGIWMFDTGLAPPETSATATNVTIVDSGGDIRLDNSHLTLNSSIIGEVAPHAGAACTISFSIGPANPGGDTTGCFDFASNADPMLADPLAGDLHLTTGSPAIDAGDPADPGSGEVDFDGDPRAVDGADACPPADRRDIGADEFIPATPIDCTPPQTSITSGPADGGVTNDPTPTFGLGSDEPGSTFECALDGGAFGPCTGAAQHTLDLTSEPDGEHTFEVRATDGGGNTDTTPAARTFTLDRAAPQTTIMSGPANGVTTNDETPTFGIGSNEAGGSLQCKVDGGAFGPCTGAAQHTLDLASAADGRHTFSVRAVDAVGNVDATPASRTFTLDSTAPETTFTKTPPKKLRKKRAVFSFIADETATYTCRLDSKPEFTCAGTVRLNVKRGKHTFSVFAIDSVGNADATPVTHKFKRVKKKRRTR